MVSQKKISTIKEFSYVSGMSIFVTRVFPILILVIFLLISVIFIQKNPPKDLFYTLIVFNLIMFIGIVIQQYFYPNIKIQNNSIELVFPLKKYVINPDKIVDLVILDRAFRSNILRVDLDNFPFVYKIVGNMAGSKNKPSILIRADINKYNDLLKVLIDMTGISPKKQLWH